MRFSSIDHEIASLHTFTCSGREPGISVNESIRVLIIFAVLALEMVARKDRDCSRSSASAGAFLDQDKNTLNP